MLEAEGRVVLRYEASSEASPCQPNPNGSANHIAGIANAAGTVVGIMPHPERAVDPRLGSADGLLFMRSLAGVRALAGVGR
jgi:phosphoribosylformylglycinamidine synthase